VDINSWRAKHAWTLTGADRVIAPAVEGSIRVRRYYPEARVVAAEHTGLGSWKLVQPLKLDPAGRLRIAVLGTMGIHKGFELLDRCAAAARRSTAPLEFVLVGSV
jgi:hypothetical protein